MTPQALMVQALAALAGVRDPELALPLGELGMLGEVRCLDGGRGLRVEVTLTTASCPLASEIRASIVAALAALPNRPSVEVVFTAMTEPERMALARRLADSARRPPAERIYAVASGKGGVGKSTVTANLAVALADQGLSVGLIDADVWGYSIPQLFGVRRHPVALKGMMLPLPAYGVRLMSTGFLVDDDEPVVWRGPMLHKALEQFIGDVYWGALDVLLLDLPPGTGDITISLLELLPDAALLAVTTPQVAAGQVAARVGRLARDVRMPIAGVIENMSACVCASCGAETAVFGHGAGQQLADHLGVPLLGEVPLDIAAREAGDLGVPLVRRAPHSPAARSLAGIAQRLPTVRRTLVGRSLGLSVV